MSSIVYYLATLAVFFFIYNILTWGLNIQFGYAGILDFTYITFMAAGAYVTGVFTLGPPPPGTGEEYILGLGWPFIVGLVAGAIGAAAVGFGIGLVALNRLRSDYLAIVTLAAGSILYGLAGNLTGLFDGFNGLSGVPAPFNSVFNLDPNTYILFFVPVAGICMIVLWFVANRIYGSPLGRTMRAIRDDQDVAEAFGKDSFRVRMLAMGIGCAFAGVAGALTIGFISAFSPAGWTTGETFVIWAALLLGGKGNNWGSVVGALLVAVVFNEATRFLPAVPGNAGLVPALRNVAIGSLLILTLWIRPEGVLPERKARFFEVPLRPSKAEATVG